MAIPEEKKSPIQLLHLATEFTPRPHTQKLWLDVLFVLFIAAIHMTILPSVLGKYVKVDLITPWLVIHFVVQRPFPATILAMISAFTLESHSAVPSGIYLCIYWIMGNVIMQVRTNLSWRHNIPWLAAFALAELWVILFETFVLVFTAGINMLTFTYLGAQLTRMISGVAFGFCICQPWLKVDAEEAVPQ